MLTVATWPEEGIANLQEVKVAAQGKVEEGAEEVSLEGKLTLSIYKDYTMQESQHPKSLR